MSDALIQVVDPEFQRELTNLLLDKLIDRVGIDAFELNHLALLGATLDYQIQTFYKLHEMLWPEGLPIAKVNLANAAAGR